MAVRPGKNGTWIADFYINKKKVIKTGFKRKKDALSHIDKRKSDFNDINKAKNERFETMMFSEIANLYVSKHLSHGKARDNVSYCKNIVSHFGDQILSKITTTDVRTWVDDLQIQVSPKTNRRYAISTIEKHVTYLNCIFNYAISREIIAVNPIKLVKFTKFFKKKTKRNKHFSQEEFFILEHLFVDTSWYIRGILKILWHTGMRIGEVLNLKWNEINLVDGIIILGADRVKEGKVRTIGVEKEALELLESIKKLNNKKGANSKIYVFGITKDNPLRYSTFYNNFRKMVSGSIFSAYNIHDIRHSYAIRKRREGSDKEVIKAQMGHVTDSMWDWYNDVASDEVAEMSGHNIDQREFIENDIEKLVEKMKREGISLNTVHTVIREKMK